MHMVDSPNRVQQSCLLCMLIVTDYDYNTDHTWGHDQFNGGRRKAK